MIEVAADRGAYHDRHHECDTITLNSIQPAERHENCHESSSFQGELTHKHPFQPA